MTERIKKLSEQAYDDIIERTGDIVVFQEDFQQRFAELIIKEVHYVIVVGGVDDLDIVLEHFGVEE